MNPLVENSLIKEYIFNTSLLHYRVEWKLTIICDGNQPEVVFSLPRSESVLSNVSSKIRDISALIFKTEVCVMDLYCKNWC